MIVFQSHYDCQVYPHEKTTDIATFNASSKYKVAVLQPDYNVRDCVIPLRKLLDQLIDSADQVIIFSVEVNFSIQRLMNIYDLPKVTFLINGFLNYSLEHARVVPNTFWLSSTAARQYHHNTFDVHKKQYVFEAMYGQPKKHRQYVHDRITANVNDSVLQTPFLTASSTDAAVITPGPYWEDDIELIPGDIHNVMHGGSPIIPSQILPRKIYALAAYSIVCETSILNGYSFFTEKIAKPLIAGRLFIVFSGQYYLKNLRRLGFKTFDGIIDESYDDIKSDTLRWSKALAEVYKLIEQDQEEVLAKCYEIFKHNNQVLNDISVEYHLQVEKMITIVSEEHLPSAGLA